MFIFDDFTPIKKTSSIEKLNHYTEEDRRKRESDNIKIDEVCLLTNDVQRHADFYKQILETENNSSVETHQFILAEGTALTIYNDETVKNDQNQNICPAFTVENIDKEYEKVLALGARIIEAPVKRPWGATNMSFYDPDNNVIFFRSFPKDG